MKEIDDYKGRLVTQSQLPQDLRRLAQELPAMRKEKGQLFCNRCSHRIDKETEQLPVGAYYCRECLLLGRVRSDECLYYFPQEDFPKQEVLRWKGKLTDFQEKVS